MRRFKKEEKKMMKFAHPKGKKIKVTHHAAAGMKKPKIKKHGKYQKKA